MYGYTYFLKFSYINDSGDLMEEHFYMSEKIRMDTRPDGMVSSAKFDYNWVDGRKLYYYRRTYKEGVSVGEKIEYEGAISFGIGSIREGSEIFTILDANYYVTLVDGVTVVYTPQNLARFVRPQLHQAYIPDYETYNYPYYFKYEGKTGNSPVYTWRVYCTQKPRFHDLGNGTSGLEWHFSWANYVPIEYMRFNDSTGQGPFYNESIGISFYGYDYTFRLIEANYIVRHIDGETLYYNPYKFRRRRIVRRYSAAEERLIPTP